MKRSILMLITSMYVGVSASAQTWEKWTKAGDETVNNAVTSGKSASGDDIFVARADYNGGTHPGKWHNGNIYIGWGGKEVGFESGQILTVTPGKTYSWVDYNGYIPKGAFAGGKENGQKLYVCRASYKGDMLPGKVVSGNCNISWGGEEIVIPSGFEVLKFASGGGKTEDNNTVVETVDAEIGLDIGDKAPELKFESPDGNMIALSSLRGKYVLIDFWASWCGPCRRENPNVVANYRKYKNASFKNGNGFTVYSLSLDTKKTNWEKAVKADELEWPNHVSDLRGWDAEGAKLYKVRGIPTNVLIDGNGIIVAKNLRGHELGQALEIFLK